MESSIFIRLPSIEVNVDHIMGHASEGLARSDGDDSIVEWTANVNCEEIPLTTDVLPLIS